jgi:hypothetical protein
MNAYVKFDARPLHPPLVGVAAGGLSHQGAGVADQPLLEQRVPPLKVPSVGCLRRGGRSFSSCLPGWSGAQPALVLCGPSIMLQFLRPLQNMIWLLARATSQSARVSYCWQLDSPGNNQESRCSAHALPSAQRCCTADCWCELCVTTLQLAATAPLSALRCRYAEAVDFMSLAVGMLRFAPSMEKHRAMMEKEVG